MSKIEQKTNTWRKVKLGELDLDISDGNYSSKYPAKTDFVKEGVPFIRADNFRDGRIAWEDMRFISAKKHQELQKGHLKKDDVLITTRGEIGKIAYIENEFVDANINAQIVRLNTTGKIDPRFFFYLLLRKSRSGYFQNIQTGTALQQLPVGILKNIEVDLPSSSDQKRIADILSAFDDKIELNNKISRALEQMAQAIFKEWFVDNSKIKDQNAKLWEEKWLGEIIQFEYGKALKAEERETGDIPVVGSSGIVGMHNQKLVTGPGIVVGRKGTVGSIIWLDTDFYPIDTTFYVVSKLSLYFCFFILKRQKFIAGDSAVPGLNRNTALSSEMLVPPKELIDKFEEQVKPLFQKMYNIKVENQKLAALRDLLLPKLMKGEIRV